jgi:uncharacterized SAM-binding protein YcdF (DUF218 family)
MKKISITLFILGVLSLFNVILLYMVSNLNIGFIMQALISVILIAYAVFINKIPKKVHIVIGIICMIPVIFTMFLFIYGNVSNAEYNEDVVIVLGAGIIGETVTRPLANRLNTALDYWSENPDAHIIVCGGLGNRASITEAEAMARYLSVMGVPRERILLEELSTSTHENLTFAKEILNDYFPGGYKAVLVTNDFHIYRSVNMARSIGIETNRLGAYTDWYTMPVNYIREMMAVAYMWVFM